jgi:predicted secreted Zn-dependent protease
MERLRKPLFHLITLIIGLFLPAIIACSFNREPGLTEIGVKVSAEQGPEVSIDYVYYKIKGATANELRTQMDQLGPVDIFGHRHDMYTKWDAYWSYPYSQEEGGCTTGPIEVRTTITFTFPTWEPPPDTSAELVDQWNGYLKLGQLHEDGHKEIALEAGREILRALQAVTAHASCDLLEQEVDQKGQELLEQFRQKEVTYDQRTDHGATQGVRFP